MIFAAISVQCLNLLSLELANGDSFNPFLFIKEIAFQRETCSHLLFGDPVIQFLRRDGINA